MISKIIAYPKVAQFNIDEDPYQEVSSGMIEGHHKGVYRKGCICTDRFEGKVLGIKVC